MTENATERVVETTKESHNEYCEQDADRILVILSEEFCFVPEIECNPIARNGRIKIQITNFDKLLENGKFPAPHAHCFQLIFRDTASVNEEWNARDIKIGNVSNDGSFDVIFPVYLHDYTVLFTLRAINIQTEEWLTFADPIVAQISSMLIDTAFSIGDCVLFRVNAFGCRGRITELLEDNMYNLEYHVRNEEEEDGYITEHEIADRTRVFRMGTPQQYEIALFDSTEAWKQMLMKRDDVESIAVFESIMDVYDYECFMYCAQTYGFREALSLHESVTVFLTKNIFDFLFEAMPHYDLRVKCLVDPYNDGKLKMQNLREMAMTKYYNTMKNGTKLPTQAIETAGENYQCDWCYSAMNQFDFVFNCDAKCSEKHDLCLNCVYTVIKLGMELSSWLNKILQNELDDDCIDVIVDYVVGRPICYVD